ncbi:MAG: hypothetical protein PHP23_05720 [Desulfobacterales bacterium]|nr:hypothetical protein [Desulfobacterales bacterium]MDD4071410.1 hypothetical protein [Desulfobacterales bacterium]MDD4391455.1 hypothetical protein [Desulfobacterales bacterium]
MTLVLDDFIAVRASKKAPSVAFHNDHAKRANRPKFLWGQLRVSLGIICFRKGKVASLPLMMRLIRTKGNTFKLQSAEMMLQLLFKWLPCPARARLLVDAWYMKKSLLLPLIAKSVTVIGQVR